MRLPGAALMRALSYSPVWRDSMVIRLFAEPNQLFFDRLDHNNARFVLLSNGSIYWGDAFTVLHKDIVQASEGGAHPIVVGVLHKGEGDPQWTVSPTQGFASGTTCSDNERSMLRALIEWRRIEGMLGEFVWLDNYGEAL